MTTLTIGNWRADIETALPTLAELNQAAAGTLLQFDLYTDSVIALSLGALARAEVGAPYHLSFDCRPRNYAVYDDGGTRIHLRLFANLAAVCDRSAAQGGSVTKR